MRYLKVTNAKENHHGLQYRDGLNVDTQPFSEEGSCVPGGLYYTDLPNIHRYYEYGVWVREIELPLARSDFKNIKDPTGDKWRASCLVLGKKVSLLDPDACTSFGIPVPSMAYLSRWGSIKGLEWYKTHFKDIKLQYNSLALDEASAFGQVEVLNWWKASGLPLQYTAKALDSASYNNEIAVLNWWLFSGLPLRYTSKALDQASTEGQVQTLEWWKNSGLELRYTNEALIWASAYGKLTTLDWWKSSALVLKYKADGVPLRNGDEFVQEAMDLASANGFVAVLEWWRSSGLQLHYTAMAVDLASIDGHVDVLEWWKNSGLEFKYTPKPMYLHHRNNAAVSKWWQKSGLAFQYTVKCSRKSI